MRRISKNYDVTDNLRAAAVNATLRAHRDDHCFDVSIATICHSYICVGTELEERFMSNDEEKVLPEDKECDEVIGKLQALIAKGDRLQKRYDRLKKEGKIDTVIPFLENDE